VVSNQTKNNVMKLSIPDDIEQKAVVISNRLIEARYQLSIFQIRLIWLFASQIKRGEEDFRFYQVPIRDVVRVIGKGTKRAHEKIEMAVIGLIGSVVEIPTRKKEASSDPTKGRKQPKRRSWARATWVASAEYKADEGVIEFEFSDKLKPFLLQLTREFTVIEFQHLLSLSSKYSARIYMLLRQYRPVGERTMALDELRFALAIADAQYERFNDFSRFVLDLAMREVSEKTDLSFTWQGLKTGRRVTRIKFTIQPKNVDLFPMPPAGSAYVVKELQTLGVSHSQALNIWNSQWECLDKHAHAGLEADIVEGLDFAQYVRDKIQLLRISQQKGTNIPNPGGWLLRAIEQNFTTADQATKRQRRAKQRQVEQATETERQRQLKEDTARDARYAELDERLTTLADDDRRRISEEIENRIKAGLNDFFRMKYATEPFDPMSPFHRSEYYKNLEELLREERAIPAA